MLSVPVRELLLVFAATEYPTVPLPVPLAPAVIVIQLALLDALREHVVALAETLTLPLPPE